MKIMSLNVHRFFAVYPEEGSWQKEIIAAVKMFLNMDPGGIVFLYEIPRRYHKTQRLEALFGTSYQMICSGNAYFFTLAISKRKLENDQSDVLTDSVGFFNRYIEVVDNGLNILAVHAPLENNYNKNRAKDVKKFFEALKEYAEKNAGKRTVILGDLNVHSGKPNNDYYRIFKEIQTSWGYSDLVSDGTPTYFPNGNTLDHVLVSSELEEKVTAKVIAQEDLELSDHAVVIVDIKE